MTARYSVLEICAGAGGQAIGLERAGFECAGAVEIEKAACETLRKNRPMWRVLESDVRNIRGAEFRGVDLLAGGVPCPPFSIAGKQLGASDERDLFPEAIRLAQEIRPRAILLENVPGFASSRFEAYRRGLFEKLAKLGFHSTWQVLQASDLGVPQLRPRFVLVALRDPDHKRFEWTFTKIVPRTVGETLQDLMSANGWRGTSKWVKRADGIAPTIVGGSKKHGGPDLGPTRAKRQWAELGVDGMGIADEAPNQDFPVNAMPRLTVRMAARIQGFPDDWHFVGRKTAAYRQVGNAFPAPVAEFVASRILAAFSDNPLVDYPDAAERQMLLLESKRRAKKGTSKKGREASAIA